MTDRIFENHKYELVTHYDCTKDMYGQLDSPVNFENLCVYAYKFEPCTYHTVCFSYLIE